MRGRESNASPPVHEITSVKTAELSEMPLEENTKEKESFSLLDVVEEGLKLKNLDLH
jgi:hypothetical protein